MSGVSLAQTPCDVIYHVYQYKNKYGEMLRSLNRARNYHAEGKFYCINFLNPLSGVKTLLTGERVIQICDHPTKVVWCSSEERIAGLVLLNASFFRCLLGAFYKAETARNKLQLYCKSVKVPLSLFPALPAEYSVFTVRGDQILAIMCSALGFGGVPSIVREGGPPLQFSSQTAIGL